MVRKRSDRLKQPSAMRGEVIMSLVMFGFVGIAIGSFWWVMIVGGWLTERPSPTGVIAQIKSLIARDTAWTGLHTVLVFVPFIIAGVIAVVIAMRRSKKDKTKARVDESARFMGRGWELEQLSLANAKEKAEMLGVETDVPGLQLGQTVIGNQMLYSTWEDLSIDIWGTRRGKSTSRVIPALLSAPGPALTTSNKRDVLDATRDVRAVNGEVWVFDPQGVAQEEPAWWWNPLTFVVDETKADELAEHFAASVMSGGSRNADPFFTNKGKTLLSSLLLAAAVDKRPILDVYGWVTDERSARDAVDILDRHGYLLQSQAVAMEVAAPDKQRAGVFSTAEGFVSCLRNSRLHPWIMKLGENDKRPHFVPEEFVEDSNTLYSLSREGAGNAGAIVTALTVAVADAGVRKATRSPKGRLKRPLVMPLDEIANVCRWSELPNLYSHYGSRGIIIMSILQSWSQGVDVWGPEGMRKLFSAANIRIFGGGVAEREFLSEISDYVGDYDKRTRSISAGPGGGSTSSDIKRETTLSVADLQALSRFRAVVIASGAPATLIKTIPWMTSDRAPEVQASIEAHDPGYQKGSDDE